jgi:CHAT domain-containing protein
MSEGSVAHRQSGDRPYQLRIDEVTPFSFIRVFSVVPGNCPACGWHQTHTVAALVDWWDRFGAAQQVSDSLGCVCTRCGDIQVLGLPLLQYRRGDVPGLLVAFPPHSEPASDTQFITDVLAVAKDRAELEGAAVVVSVRMGWWRELWNRPVGPLLFGGAQITLPSETLEEVQRWRADTVQSLGISDVGPALSDFINADNKTQEAQVLTDEPRLTAIRWRGTIRSLETAPRRVDANGSGYEQDIGEKEVDEHVTRRFERLRLLQLFGSKAVDAISELDQPATALLIEASEGGDPVRRQQLIGRAEQLLASSPPSAVTSALGNALVAVMFGDQNRSLKTADSMIDAARRSLERAERACGYDHEITFSARLNLAAALEERCVDDRDSDYQGAERLLIEVAGAATAIGSPIAADAAVNLVSLQQKRSGDRPNRALNAAELLEDATHINRVMQRDDQRSRVVTLADEAAALRSRMTGNLLANARASLAKLEQAREIDVETGVLSQPERVLLTGNFVNALYQLHEHDPLGAPSDRVIQAADDAIVAARTLNRLHPTAVDVELNGASVLLNMYTELAHDPSSIEIWSRARDALEDATSRAVELDPRDLRTLRAKQNLAAAYGCPIDGEPADVARCAQLLTEVIEAAPSSEPEFRFIPAINLGQLHFGQGHWTEAADAYEIARKAQIEMIGQARTELTKIGQILQTKDLAARRALAFVMGHQPERAISALEENRAQLRRRHTGTRSPLPQTSTVIHVATSAYGTAVIISLPNGDLPAFAVALGSCDMEPLVHLLLASQDKGQLFERFDLLADLVADAIVGPVTEIIEASGCQIEELELVACGALVSVPLHCVMVDGRSWIDRWRVRYRVAAETEPQTSRPSPNRTVGAFAKDPYIPFALTEREAVKGWTHELLEPPDGILRRAWLLDALKTATTAHFACHAGLDAHDPLESAISLGNERIKVSDLSLAFDLDLVVVPACQSGSAYLGAPDELLGVGHAFIHAGARAVIASLWDADDAACAYTMAGFYRELGRGADACSALTAAQREAARLSGADVAELAEQFVTGNQRVSWISSELLKRLVSLCEARGILGSNEQIFAHPAEWGALSYLD